MKGKIAFALNVLNRIIAGVAVMVALSNVQSTCLFLTYQPDIPDELK